MDKISYFFREIPKDIILQKVAEIIKSSSLGNKQIMLSLKLDNGIFESQRFEGLGKDINITSQLSEIAKRSYLKKIIIKIYLVAVNNPNSFQPESEFLFHLHSSDDGLGCEIDFFARDNALADSIVMQLNNVFEFVPKFELVKSQMSQAEQAMIETRETIFNALQEASKNLISTTTEQIGKWNDKFIEMTDNLHKRHNESEQELQKQYQTKQTDLDDKVEQAKKKIELERAAFEEKQKAFDDRERTHVRRELLQKIKGIIDENKSVSLSESTVAKRTPIIVACYLILLFSIIGITAFAWLFISGYLNSKVLNYTLLFPMTSFVLIFISTFIYYIKWQNQWLKAHADAEFANKKFESDILRASWITEMFFEWDEEKKNAFPEQLINSFTKNLFESNTVTKSVSHPIEDIVKAAGDLSKLKVGKEGFEIKKAVKKK